MLTTGTINRWIAPGNANSLNCRAVISKAFPAIIYHDSQLPSRIIIIFEDAFCDLKLILMTTSLIKADYHSLIHEIRGYKVMLDFDLAALYGVETKRLKESVRRNIDRFPEDFMFELNKDEFLTIRTQFATSKRGGSRYAPMVFTEQGVAMLSSVLNSDKAIKVNIEIMRAFAKYRAFLIENQDLKGEIRAMDEKINKVFKFLLDRIDELHQNEIKPKKKIGYKSYDQ